MPDAAAWLFAASTLGVVEEDLPTTVATFRRHGVRAVELRSAPGAFVYPTMPVPERLEVRRRFEDADLDVFAVASRVKIAAPGEDDDVVEALVRELQLAADLGARYVRVFPGAPTRPAGSDELPELAEDADTVDARAVARLTRVLDTAAAQGVQPVVETHDSHPRGADVARLLQRLDAQAPGHGVGAIWDVLHPWRVGEPLTQTAEVLLDRVLDGRGYVQLKDVASPADTFPVPQGQGVVPLQEMLGLLDEAGYRGPVSLEWERFWKPQAAPLDAALPAAAAALAAHPPA